MASRLPMARLSCSLRLQRRPRLGAVRAFSSNRGDQAWRNETPVGSTTEVFVYSPDTNIEWPDPRLGVLGSGLDPAFSLPGNIGASPSSTFPRAPPLPGPGNQPDVLTVPTNKENQLHALYNANDFIKYTPGSDSVVLALPSLLPSFPALPSAEAMELVAHSAPLLLRKQLKELFPQERDKVEAGPLTVLTLAIRTQSDMSAWSEEMEAEREKLTEHTIIVAKEICGRLKEEGHWADFIDPCSGTPHYSGHSATTMFETDERYRLLGFRIEDLGCCKVIEHNRFGRNVFVGCVVTNAASKGDVIENIVEDLSA